MSCIGCIHYEACFVHDVLIKDDSGQLSEAVTIECPTFRYANIIGAIEVIDDLREAVREVM